jgi:catechol 2,3-dioxygenase-like lactoylglutathione lyase family enzyme
MRYNHLIPELSVSDFNKSKKFYVNVLGFKVEYDRPESNFAYLSFQGSQLMIDGGNNKENSPWYTGKLEYPRGRGVHFQLDIDDLRPLIKSLKKHNYPIKVAAKDYWYRQGKFMMGMKGLLIMDPDGYLLMFNQDLGKKKVDRIDD